MQFQNSVHKEHPMLLRTKFTFKGKGDYSGFRLRKNTHCWPEPEQCLPDPEQKRFPIYNAIPGPTVHKREATIKSFPDTNPPPLLLLSKPPTRGKTHTREEKDGRREDRQSNLRTDAQKTSTKTVETEFPARMTQRQQCQQHAFLHRLKCP